MIGLQLDFEGREHDLAEVRAETAPAPFTPSQREILRLIQTYGTITSTAAGRIVHAHREERCLRCAGNQTCQYAASDGRDALMRLKDRGLVHRHRPGVWTAVNR